MEQTLTNTDRIPIDNGSGNTSKKKKCERNVVDGQCKTRSYIVRLTMKRKRIYRKGYVQNQSKSRSNNRIIKDCALERTRQARILDSSIKYIKSLKQRNTQSLNLERSQIKLEWLLDNMNLILQNLEHKMDLYTSRRSQRNHEHFRSKG